MTAFITKRCLFTVFHDAMLCTYFTEITWRSHGRWLIWLSYSAKAFVVVNLSRSIIQNLQLLSALQLYNFTVSSFVYSQVLIFSVRFLRFFLNWRCDCNTTSGHWVEYFCMQRWITALWIEEDTLLVICTRWKQISSLKAVDTHAAKLFHLNFFLAVIP